MWNKREGELIAANKLDRIVAQPPEPKNVHAGSATEDIKAKIGREGARTIPGRPEHGMLISIFHVRNLNADLGGAKIRWQL